MACLFLYNCDNKHNNTPPRTAGYPEFSRKACDTNVCDQDAHLVLCKLSGPHLTSSDKFRDYYWWDAHNDNLVAAVAAGAVRFSSNGGTIKQVRSTILCSKIVNLIFSELI